MKRILLLASLCASSAIAQTLPPANVQMANGTPRATTPAITYCRDGTDIVICPIASGGGGGGAGDASATNQTTQIAAEQAIRDRIGDTTSPVAGSTNGRLNTINTTLGSPFQAGGSIGNTGFAVTNTPTVNLGTLNGAATAARQPTIGTAGSSSSDVLSVQGIAGGTPQPTILTSGSATIGAISNTSFAATQTTAANLNATIVGTGTLAVQNTAATPAGTNNIGSLTNITGTVTLPTGASTESTLSTMSGKLPASLGAKTTANSLSVGPSTDGLWQTVANTAATAAAGAPAVTVQGATTNALKGSAGNLYSLNAVNSTSAGFLVVYNATTAPTSGTALAAGSTPYCMPVAASVGFRDSFASPLYLSTGIVLLFSTSCTTYTPVGTAPVTLTGQFK